MAAPLIPHSPSTKAAETELSRSEQDHLDRVRRAKSVDELISRINSGAAPDLVETRKAAPIELHPSVKALKADISPTAAKLLSLVVRADERYRGAQKIEVTAHDAARALGISEIEARAARDELERLDLIRFHDDRSGNRGFHPRLPA